MSNYQHFPINDYCYLLKLASILAKNNAKTSLISFKQGFWTRQVKTLNEQYLVDNYVLFHIFFPQLCNLSLINY